MNDEQRARKQVDSAFDEVLPRYEPKFNASRVDAEAVARAARISQRVSEGRISAEPIPVRAARALTAQPDPGNPGHLTNGLPILDEAQRTRAATTTRNLPRAGRRIIQKIRGNARAEDGKPLSSPFRVNEPEDHTVLFPYDLEAIRRGEQTP